MSNQYPGQQNPEDDDRTHLAPRRDSGEDQAWPSSGSATQPTSASEPYNVYGQEPQGAQGPQQGYSGQDYAGQGYDSYGQDYSDGYGSSGQGYLGQESQPYQSQGYPPGQQAGYGQYPTPYQGNPYGAYQAAPPNHPAATPALIMGLIGLITMWGCGISGLVGIGGIIQGRKALREIDAEPGRWSGRGQAMAGFVTGLIAVSLTLIAIVLVIILAATGNMS